LHPRQGLSNIIRPQNAVTETNAAAAAVSQHSTAQHSTAQHSTAQHSTVLAEPYIKVSHEIGCVINGLLRELVWKLQVRHCCPLLFGEKWNEEEEEEEEEEK